MNKVFKEEMSERETKCRLCFKDIPKGESLVSLRNVYINGNTLSIFFHKQCFYDAVLNLNWRF